MAIYRKTKLLLCLELEREAADIPKYLRILFSVPGRESVKTKVWATPSGYLTDAQLADVIAWIGEHCTDAVITGYGVQSCLPFTARPSLS